MDLVTLVALCSIGVDPKVMHALVWHQSGGEPWSFTIPGEVEPRIFRKVRDVVAEARAVHVAAAVRVGLTGLSIAPSAVTMMTFLPCPNIATAARQIVQLRTRCEASGRTDVDPTSCALAAYRGSWERPDTRFAAAVRASVANGDAPDFDMPEDTGLAFRDMVLDLDAPASEVPSSRTLSAADDRERGWSSGLFPLPRSTSGDPSERRSIAGPAPDSVQRDRKPNVGPRADNPPADGLFVARSSRREP
ncbi:hypothetical protein CCR97_09260 [Rhodoplanes elegans]|uniref:Uncharacterized protein n=1 Tax=Rhodoplanes elegans TaxID=29408 RepID=A0A327KUX0_9BRAD|nr:hypothetical protein [Rhodoplanes elegans]MBK5958397.1 hypothetical protein [Rhodoplanes elegans]RAI42061.1 hypothetical protein CH338_01220 [Rhodoplanes elegans]